MGGTDVTMPEQKSYGESLRDAMDAQIDLGPEYYESEAEYRPKYAQLETGILGQTLLGEGGMEEFQQRGLLDLMGAPAQRYATGGVAPQTGADPMAAQFEQGFTGQAPLGRGGLLGGGRAIGTPARGPLSEEELSAWKAGDPVPSGYNVKGDWGMQRLEAMDSRALRQPTAAQPFIGEGQDQRVRRPAQRGQMPQSMMQDMMLGPVSAARARENVAAAQPTPTQGGTILEQSRRPGMGNVDQFTGEEGFGGMAQYGADLAEYGAGRQRAADIRDVGRYGREATRQLRAADPLSEMMLGRMAGIAGQEMGGAAQNRFDDPLLGAMRGQAGLELARSDLGYGGLLGMMGGQAREDLAAGDSLTDRERRRAIQESRQAMEARGRQMDPLAAVNELEALERARSARRQERRGFAGQVMQAEEARRGTGRQYAANLLQMEAARRGEARGYGQQVLGTSRAMSADPFMAILGRPSGQGQQIAQQGLGSAQYGLSAGPGVVFNPEAGLSYMLGQQTNQMNLAGAQAGAKGSMMGGLMGGLGQLGGAAIMACWVAREVYGESNPKWKQFRHWMLNKSPDWFREWYLINGESVAEHIKDKPELKAQIKIFMDSKLEA